MAVSQSNPDRSLLDQATSRRLAKLSAMPMDASRLCRFIEAQIPRSSSQPRPLGLQWLKSTRALAASVIVLLLIGALVINSSSGPALASANRLAQIHDEMIAGIGVVHIDSIDAANQTLAAKAQDGPLIPQLAEVSVICCGLRSVSNKRVACVTVRYDGVLVTLAVAKASDIKMPATETRVVNAMTYYVQSHDRTNMVMTERNGRWICLMGNESVDWLIELAVSFQL